MNEKHIEEVVNIEKQAQELLANATREAERLPVQAETEVRAMIEKARTSASEEARTALERIVAADDAMEIAAKAQQRMGEIGKTAEKNLERAVAYVLERVVGRA